MNRIYTIFNNRTDSRFHFLFGPGIQDLFVSSTFTLVNILNSLNSVLLSEMYDRIIHVSPTNIVRCIDEKSKRNTANIMWPERETVLLSGVVEGIVTGPLGRANNPKDGNKTNTQNRGLSDIHGIRLLDSLMKDHQEFRTASVFYDGITFSNHFESQRILYGILNEWFLLPSENRNECFFIIPVDQKDVLLEQIKGSPLSQFLMTGENGSEMSNCIQIGYPNEYEIRSIMTIDPDPETANDYSYQQLIRMCVLEQEPLRTWLHRLSGCNKVNIKIFRNNGWLKSSDGDPRSVDEKLDRYVGLGQVKEFVRLIQGLANYYYQTRENPYKTSLHMVFYGSPGTGKTSIGRLFGQIFQESGLLRRGHLIEVKGSDFIAGHVGGTGIKTNQIVDRAIDGILFIDEAYSLSGDERGGFGKEALEVIIKRMEDERDRLVVILAGYKDSMQDFFKANPGLERRFPAANRIEFTDFSQDELNHILSNEMDTMGLYRDDEVKGLLDFIVEDIYKKRSKNFGNAGEMRNMAESINIRVKARIARGKNQRYQILGEDIPDQYLPLVNRTVISYEDVISPLNSLVGMEHIKNHILSLAKLIKLDFMINEQKLIRRERYMEHYLFLGNPGTGKTTTAKVMSEMLFRLGVLRTRNLIEVTAVDLIASYVGQTAEKTRRVIESSLDGVLFIDEAYTLHQGSGGVRYGYGKEVIDTLVKLVDQYKDRFVVIMAGYPDVMIDLVQSNPGLNSRFTKIINFPDYTEDQLGEILVRLSDHDHYILTDEVLEQARNILIQVQALSPRTFGNAREVQRLFRHMTQNLANRVVSDPLKVIHRDELYEGWNVFQMQDVDAYEVIVEKNPNAYDGTPFITPEYSIRKKRKRTIR